MSRLPAIMMKGILDTLFIILDNLENSQDQWEPKKPEK